MLVTSLLLSLLLVASLSTSLPDSTPAIPTSVPASTPGAPAPLAPGPGLHFIAVGQGSALLLRSRAGEFVLIDSGPPAGAEAVTAALAEHEVEALALWVHTHHDADHLGGFARVLAGADARWPSADDPQVELLWDRGFAAAPQTDAVALYRQLAGDRRRSVVDGDTFVAEGLRIEALALAPPQRDAGENERGLALCIELEGLRLLVPGDLPSARVELAAAACPQVDLLWVSHHGAADGTSEAALALADPRAVVISAGFDNPYCHPAPVTLAHVGARRAWILAAAGIAATGHCPALAEHLGADHIVLGGDLWLDGLDRPDIGLSAQVRGGPGLWSQLP